MGAVLPPRREGPPLYDPDPPTMSGLSESPAAVGSLASFAPFPFLKRHLLELQGCLVTSLREGLAPLGSHRHHHGASRHSATSRSVRHDQLSSLRLASSPWTFSKQKLGFFFGRTLTGSACFIKAVARGSKTQVPPSSPSPGSCGCRLLSG